MESDGFVLPDCLGADLVESDYVVALHCCSVGFGNLSEDTSYHNSQYLDMAHY